MHLALSLTFLKDHKKLRLFSLCTMDTWLNAGGFDFVRMILLWSSSSSTLQCPSDEGTSCMKEQFCKDAVVSLMENHCTCNINDVCITLQHIIYIYLVSCKMCSNCLMCENCLFPCFYCSYIYIYIQNVYSFPSLHCHIWENSYLALYRGWRYIEV